MTKRTPKENTDVHGEAAFDVFAAIVGLTHVISDRKQRQFFSRDIFYWDAARDADLVVQPGTPGEVGRVVRAASDFGYHISTRGGGMSYTNGYGPAEAKAVLIDTRRLDAIRTVNRTDRYVIVEAGCTWQQVDEALKPLGFKVMFPAPFSGVYSTVGGALSQGVPMGMVGILGLEVVRADGKLVHTGSWSAHENASPFFRNFGPDLTGLFLGDCGTFGIKTAAALQIEPRPRHLAHASFAYESYEDLCETYIEMGPFDFLIRRVGLDPFKSQNAAKVGFKEAVRTLGDVTGSGPSLLSGLRDSMKMATAGGNFMKGVKWSLHLTAKGAGDKDAVVALELAREVCLKRGREIPNILPRAMDARLYSIRGFLGKDGQRWVPTNSIFPLSRAVEVATAVQEFFDKRRVDMDRWGMWESYMNNSGAGYFMCEPSFYWLDEVSELHLAHLPADEARKFRKIEANPDARRYAMKLRDELRDFFYDIGAIHVQLAKFYRYQESLGEETRRLVNEVKDIMDPRHILNRANLGFE